MIEVLRLSHRPFRDKRITTHCALVARAFGADKFFYSGQKDNVLEKSINKVNENWGGEFPVEFVHDWKRFVKEFSGRKAHLTVYGVPLQKKLKEIKKVKNILVIVGGKKVPSDIYKMVDFNISITNQPHSEVSSISCFLDYLFEGKELKKIFRNPKFKIVPREKGKKVVKVT